jgi:hypothetical protein
MKTLLLTVFAALTIAAGASASTSFQVDVLGGDGQAKSVPPFQVDVLGGNGQPTAVPSFQVDVLGGNGQPATPPATVGIPTWYLFGIAVGSALAVAGVALLVLYGRRRRIGARAVLA